MSCGTSSAPSDRVECAWQSTGFHAIRLRDLERVGRRVALGRWRDRLAGVRRSRSYCGIERLVHVERRVPGAFLDRLGPGDEVLGHDRVGSAGLTGQLAGRAV